MRHSPLRSAVLFALSLSLGGAVLVGCSGSDDPEAAAPTETATDAAELKATIGPEGGTLEGAPDTMFAGVKLVIPAGALAAASPVIIRPTLDPVPLPELAERVGAQFSIEGPALASPASLTLPVDAGSVRRFEKGDADVKVWARTGEGWQLVEATATALGSVTIPLATFTTAAAGVKILAGGTFCERFPQSTNCQPGAPPAVAPAEIPLSQPCNVPEAYCLSKIATASPSPENLDNFEVTADGIFYLFGESLGRVSVAKVDLATGAVAQVVKSHATTSTVRRNMAVDAGTIWVGLGPNLGNAHLRTGDVAEVFDTDRNATGAVQVPNGPFLRLDQTVEGGILKLEVAARNGASFGPRKQVALANGDGSATRIKAEAGGGALWAMQSLNLRRSTVAADGTLAAGGSLSLPSEGDQFYVDFALSTTNRIAVLHSGRFGYHENASSPFTQLDVGAVFDATFLSSSPLLATAASAPEIFVELGSAALPKRIKLTSAPSTDPVYTSRIPRGIRQVPGTSSAVFLTQGREFYLLRISTSTIQ